MKATKVVILGCGPAGLMAAHGAMAAGASDIAILSKKRKSEMFGAQYLHAPIPMITKSAAFTVTYRLVGTADGYRRKVYGDEWKGRVSPESLVGQHDAWDIREAYDTLWSMFESAIHEFSVDPLSIDDIERNMGPDLIINTVPRTLLCRKQHQFQYTTVWAAGDAPERGIMLPYKQAGDNEVICNGEVEPAWYRLSNIDGYRTAEWPERSRPPIHCAAVTKPTQTNCDCNGRVMHAGRYGCWDKSVLSHTAYEQAYRATVSKMAAWA